tara:strand:- start:4908 stop:5477 length:570 start_codon:yes stop_codon:yes gene_type:complete
VLFRYQLVYFLLCLTILSGCSNLPNGLKPIDDFDLDRYLGEWYEIARLDHSFERGLYDVRANYALRADGGIEVKNFGVLSTGTLKEATGKAYFIGSKQLGHLKVSFFGFFYSSYIIFFADEDYQTAFVAGGNHSYLWLLSRDRFISESTRDHFIELTTSLGFNTDNLIWGVQRPDHCRYTGISSDQDPC